MAITSPFLDHPYTLDTTNSEHRYDPDGVSDYVREIIRAVLVIEQRNMLTKERGDDPAKNFTFD